MTKDEAERIAIRSFARVCALRMDVDASRHGMLGTVSVEFQVEAYRVHEVMQAFGLLIGEAARPWKDLPHPHVGEDAKP